MRLNGGTIATPPARRFTGAPLHPYWFELGSLIPRWRQTAGSSSGSTTVNDTTFENFTSVTLVRDWDLPITTIPRSAAPSITITSDNLAVATVDGQAARYASSGSANITITCPERTVVLPLNFASVGGVTSSQFSSYVSGSACRHASDQIDSRLVGKSASSALQVFTTQDHALGSYVRNSACWCADVDLTCISPWNSTAGTNMAGVLISPRHILFATHYPISDGATVRFVAADNTVVTRTMTNSLGYPGYVPYHPDFTVGVLDSDVPASIGFARVLPADYATKFPGATAWGKVASVCFDQEEKAIVQDWAGVYLSGATGTMDFCLLRQPTDSKRLEFFENKIGGDSGNPAFIIINGQLVLLTVLTYGGAGGGTELPPRIAGLNALMATLGGGYQLTTADLSGFPTYP